MQTLLDYVPAVLLYLATILLLSLLEAALPRVTVDGGAGHVALFLSIRAITLVKRGDDPR